MHKEGIIDICLIIGLTLTTCLLFSNPMVIISAVTIGSLAITWTSMINLKLPKKSKKVKDNYNHSVNIVNMENISKSKGIKSREQVYQPFEKAVFKGEHKLYNNNSEKEEKNKVLQKSKKHK